MIEDGLIDKDTLLDAFLSFMSEDEVKEMMSYNDLIEEDEGE